MGIGVVGCQVLKFEESADALNVVDAQRAVIQGGHAAGSCDPAGRPVAHVYGRVVHGLAVSDLRLVLQAGLGAVCGLLEREVMAARHCAQAEEGDAELAVAELPPGRRVGLVILEDRFTQLDAP
jgi:hypothetical protein